MTRYGTLIGAVACLSEAAYFNSDNDGFEEGSSEDKDQVEANLSSVASAEVASAIEAMSDTMLDPMGADADIPMAMKAISNKMDLHSASKVINHNSLPSDVSNLVQTVSDGDSDGTGFATKFDEASLDKARIALNDLVEKAWVELDNKIFKCKGFQDMNRNNYGQVTRDIMRLIEQINDLERIEAEAIEGISQKEQEILDVEALLAKETKLYNIEYTENKAELTIRQNDLDVFTFILKFTKCADATATFAQVCELRSGRKTLLFHDHATATEYKKLLNPRAKKSIDQILRSVETSFIQQPVNSTTPPPKVQKEPVIGEDGKACIGAVGQKAGGADTETGGEGMGDEDECMKACGPDPPDCVSAPPAFCPTAPMHALPSSPITGSFCTFGGGVVELTGCWMKLVSTDLRIWSMLFFARGFKSFLYSVAVAWSWKSKVLRPLRNSQT
jgi:hypothetical protein